MSLPRPTAGGTVWLNPARAGLRQAVAASTYPTACLRCGTAAASQTVPPDSRRRGAVLLEVLISMALLVFGMAVVGMQINTGLAAARHADLATRAMMLAEAKMSELSAGVVRPESNQQEMMGDFGVLYPGFTWRLEFKTTDVPTFLMVTLKIGFNEKAVEEQIASPMQELEFERPGTTVVQTVYRLMPVPADLNLERDFGITQDEIQKALGGLAGGGAEGAAGEMAEGGQQAAASQPGQGGQASNGGGMQLPAGMDPAQIMQLIGPLLQGGNIDPRMLTQLPPEVFQQVAPYLEMIIGRGGLGSPQVQQQLMQQLQSMQAGGRGGRRGGPKSSDGENQGEQGGGEQIGGDQGGPGGPQGGNTPGTTGDNTSRSPRGPNNSPRQPSNQRTPRQPKANPSSGGGR